VADDQEVEPIRTKRELGSDDQVALWHALLAGVKHGRWNGQERIPVLEYERGHHDLLDGTFARGERVAS
jgi:hypothetical protein